MSYRIMLKCGAKLERAYARGESCRKLDEIPCEYFQLLPNNNCPNTFRAFCAKNNLKIEQDGWMATQEINPHHILQFMIERSYHDYVENNVSFEPDTTDLKTFAKTTIDMIKYDSRFQFIQLADWLQKHRLAFIDADGKASLVPNRINKLFIRAC